MTYPSFIIAGNSKSGTTALWAFLNAHPGIHMCWPKEPNHLAPDFCRDPVPGSSFQKISRRDYLDYYADASDDQITGEASACYLYSKQAPVEIHDLNPDARIIAMFREPVDFLQSYHVQLLKNPRTEGEDIMDFREALDAEDDRREGRRIPRGCHLPEFLLYSERVKYAEHLQRFIDVFGRDQIKVIIYDDFKKDNEGVYDEVIQFVGADLAFRPEFATHNKGGKVVKSKRIQELVHGMTSGGGAVSVARSAAKAVLPESARKRLVAGAYKKLVFRDKESISRDLESSLKARFRPDVAAFSDLIGRDMLAEWGYGA